MYVVWVERRLQWSLRCVCEGMERGGNNLKQRERWVKVDLQQLEVKVVEVYWNEVEDGWLQILQWWHEVCPVVGNTSALFLWPVHSY